MDVWAGTTLRHWCCPFEGIDRYTIHFHSKNSILVKYVDIPRETPTRPCETPTCPRERPSLPHERPYLMTSLIKPLPFLTLWNDLPPSDGRPTTDSKNGLKSDGGVAAGGVGPKTTMFTWFVVLALLGVWSSVAVVYFDVVDYDSVIGE